MAISFLRITDFRNLKSAELLPTAQGLNIISGCNGSGKTSLLEAIYYLGLGRSFRTPNAGRLICHEANQFSVFAQLVTNSQCQLSVGTERSQDGSARLRVGEKTASGVAEMAMLLPVQVINSHSHQLFESGPAYRRKYLDWGLFYQFSPFLSVWRQYERVLKQRNAILHARRPRSELTVWTEELIKHGLALDQLRRAYVAELMPEINKLAQELLSIFNFKMIYLPGWEEDQDFAAALAMTSQDEMRFGYTLIGPHRADLEVLAEGLPIKHILSRGQQKLLICAMILAQGMLLARQENQGLIYLVDDLPSELDESSRRKLISLLSRQKNAQIFVTAIEHKMICTLENNDVPVKLFHVEHGGIETVL